MRRKRETNPSLRAFAEKANESNGNQEVLQQRITATHPSNIPRRDHPVSTSTPNLLGTKNHTQNSFELIDTPDKLLMYTIHVIEKKVDVDTRIIQLKEIRTLTDQVFAPTRKPVEIHYLQYDSSPPCRFMNLYWLKRVHVDAMDLKTSYFTLTSYGLTHVKGTNTELYDLVSWLTEKSIFDQIVQMPCIQLMRKMTTFHAWKQNSIGARYQRVRKFLSQKLLWCNLLLAPYVKCIRQTLLQVSDIATSTILDSSGPREFEDLIDIDHTNQIASLHRTIESIEEFVLAALKPLLFGHTRTSAQLAHIDIIPHFVRVVDFMVVEEIFASVCMSIDRLYFKFTGLNATSYTTDIPTDQVDSMGDVHQDIHNQIDMLLASPFQHAGNVAYKRLFQMQGAKQEFEPLFFVKIEILPLNQYCISPDKQLWLERLHRLVSNYIDAMNQIGRISANSDIREFVYNHCRPYYRQYFADDIHTIASVIFNHPLIEILMKRLRLSMDIYFAEIEHLVSTCLPLQADFRRMEKTASVDLSTPLTIMNDTCRIMHLYISFRRELKVVDSILQVGCFLVDRSSFVGNMLDDCTARLIEYFNQLPAFAKRFFKEITQEIDGNLKALSSIPESTDECMVWLECFCSVKRNSSATLQRIESIIKLAQQLLENHQAHCDFLNEDLYQVLHDIFSTGNTQWRFKIKTLTESIARVDVNQSFYQDLFSRTLSTRRELVTEEFHVVSHKLDAAMSTIDIFESSADDHFGGKDTYELLRLVRILVEKNTHLIRFETLLEQFRQLYPSAPRAVHRHRHMSVRHLSIGNIHNEYDRLHALQILLGIVESFVHLRIDSQTRPLTTITLEELYQSVSALKRQGQPHCAVLNGLNHPLVAQYVPSMQNFLDAIDIAIDMKTSRFTIERWKCLIPYISCTSPDDCTIELIETALSLPAARELLGTITNNVRVESQIQDTMHRINLELSELSIEIQSSNHGLRPINCSQILVSLEELSLSLLPLRHKHNPWLTDTLELMENIRLSAEILVHLQSFDSLWFHMIVGIGMPDFKAFVKDPMLWGQFEVMHSSWLEGLSALSHWAGPSNIFHQLKYIAKQIHFDTFCGVYEEMRHRLESYMNSMREIAPRLYYASNEALLVLLNEPNIVEQVIRCCFTGIQTVEQTTTQISPRDASQHVVGMIKSEFMEWLLGDNTVSCIHTIRFKSTRTRFALQKPVKVMGSLAFWLSQFDDVLNHSLRAQLIHAKQMFFIDFMSLTSAQIRKWKNEYPPQLLLCLIHLQFCSVVGKIMTAAPSPSARNLFTALKTGHHTSLVNLVTSMRASNDSDETLEDVILLMSFQGDTLRNLATELNIHDWSDVVLTWDHTFRFVENHNDNSKILQVRMGQISVPCGYEIQPKMSWLCITPATHRCIFALFHALRLNASVMPLGCVHSGKRTLIQGLCYVLMRCPFQFTCHAATSIASLDHFLAGVTKLEAWGCIDQVVDLPLAVFGYLMTEMRSIQRKILSSFETSEPSWGVLFLPLHSTKVDNGLIRWLGQPLRPVAIPHPNHALLLEALLLSKGFAMNTSKDINCVLAIISLAIPSFKSFCTMHFLIRIASMVWTITKQVSYVMHGHGDSGCHIRHDASPLNASRYRDSNVFRFALLLVVEAMQICPRGLLFEIIDKYLPSSLEMTQENRMLSTAFQVILEKSHYTALPSLIQKGVQLNNMIQLATPILLVGNSCTGKTTCLKTTLKSKQLVDSVAFGKEENPVHAHEFIPLSISMFESLEFDDIAVILSSGSKNKCFCIDGGGMESKLERFIYLLTSDKNATEKQPLVVTETVSLEFITPALLARSSILSFDVVDISWRNILSTWIKTQTSWPKCYKAQVAELTQASIAKYVVDFALPYHSSLPTPVPTSILMAYSLRILESNFAQLIPSTIQTDTLLEQIIFLAIIWGFGAHLSCSNRTRFQGSVQHVLNAKRGAMMWPSLDPLLALCVQENCTLYQLTIDFEENRVIVETSRHLLNKCLSSHSLLIPTSTVRHVEALFRMLHPQHVSLVCIGDQGSGKSSLLSLLIESFEHSFENLSRTPPRKRVLALQKSMLRQRPLVVFIDDICLEEPLYDSLNVSRHAILHQTLFNPKTKQVESVHPVLCATICENTLVDLTTHARHRLLRPFFVYQLPLLSDVDLQNIFNQVFQSKINRALSSTEAWIIQSTISLLQRVQNFNDISKPYQFNLPLVGQILLSTLLPPTPVNANDTISTSWLYRVKTVLWDCLGSTEDRHIMFKHIHEIISSKIELEEHDMQRMDWKAPWLSAMLGIPHGIHDIDLLFQHLKQYIADIYTGHKKIDRPRTQVINVNDAEHLLKLRDAIVSKWLVVVVGDDLTSHTNVIQIAAQITSADLIALNHLRSKDGIEINLTTLCEDIVSHQRRVILSLNDEDLDSIDSLWDFIRDYFHGYTPTVLEKFATCQSAYIPLKLSNTSRTYQVFVDDFMRRLEENLTICIHFKPQHPKVVTLLRRRNSKVVVIHSTSCSGTQHFQTVHEYFKQVISEHPQLVRLNVDLTSLAKAAVEIYSSVCRVRCLFERCSPSVFSLLDTFKHLVHLRMQLTSGMEMKLSVSKAIHLLDELKVSYVHAQGEMARWDSANDECKAKVSRNKKYLLSVDTRIHKTTLLVQDMIQKQHQKQLGHDELQKTIDQEEKKLACDRKNLENLLVTPLSTSGKQLLLHDGKEFQPLVRMTTALCLLFDEANPSMEKAALLMDHEDFLEKLIQTEVPVTTREEFILSLAYAPADFAWLHSKHPNFAAIVLWLLFKSNSLASQERIHLFRQELYALRDSMGELKEFILSSELEIQALHGSRQILCSLNEELLMEWHEIKGQQGHAKKNLQRLAPFQSFLDYYLSWLRAKFHSNSSYLGHVLFQSSLVAYAGSYPCTERQDLLHEWSTILHGHGFTLPLQLDLIGNGTISLMTDLEGKISFGLSTDTDETIRNGLTLADWSCQTPLFVDSFGFAELSLLHFLKRMELAIPNLRHQVVSCHEKNLFDTLNKSLLEGSLVILTHFETKHLKLLLPYLSLPRMSLIQLLNEVHLNTKTDRRHTFSNIHTSHHPSYSEPQSMDRQRNGIFQIYLIADMCPALTSQDLQHLNVIQFFVPCHEIQPVLSRRLASLLGPPHAAHQSCVDLTNLQGFIELHAAQIQYLEQIADTNTENDLVQSIVHIEQRKKSLDARIIHEGEHEVGICTSHGQIDHELVRAINEAAKLMTFMLHALWYIQPISIYNNKISITQMQNLLSSMTEEHTNNHSVLSEQDKCHLVDILVQQVYEYIACSLPSTCSRYFLFLVAIKKCPHTPPPEDLIAFLCESRHENHINQGRPLRRSSAQTFSQSQVHRIRRIQSFHSSTPLPIDVQDGSAIPCHIPMALWNSLDMYAQLRQLEVMFPACLGLEKHIQQHTTTWLTNIYHAFTSNHPSFLVPHIWQTPLAPLTHLLLLRCICPDLLTSHIDDFIAEMVPETSSMAPRPLFLQQQALLVVESHQELQVIVPEIGIDLKNRVAWLPRTNPHTRETLKDRLNKSVASGDTLVIDLLDENDFIELIQWIDHCQQRTPRKLIHGRVFYLCTTTIASLLPIDIIQNMQKIYLPMQKSIARSSSMEIELKENHLHHSVAGKMSRGLHMMIERVSKWGQVHSIGWRSYTPHKYHRAEVVATLGYIDKYVAQNHCAHVVEMKLLFKALEHGVFGGDLIDDYDKLCFHRTLQELTVLKQRDKGETNEILSSDVLPSSGPSPRLTTYLRNIKFLQESTSFVEQSQVLHQFLSNTIVPDQETLRHTFAIYHRVFNSFLRLHHAYTEEDNLPASPSSTGANSAMLVTVAALKFRRTVKRVIPPASSDTIKYLFDDLANLTGILLHCSKLLNEAKMASPASLGMLFDFVIPPSWLGLPDTTSPISLYSFSNYLDKCSKFFTQLKDEFSHGNSFPQVIPLPMLTAPDRFFANFRLQYALSLVCPPHELCLVMDLKVQDAGIVRDTRGIPCGVLATGVYFFDGHQNKPLFSQLPTVRLYYVPHSTLVDRKVATLSFLRLWKFDHLNEQPLGDKDIFTSIDTLFVFLNDFPFLQDPYPAHVMALSPVLDDQLRTVQYLSKQVE